MKSQMKRSMVQGWEESQWNRRGGGQAQPLKGWHSHQSVQFSSVTQLCPTLCNPMNHSMPGLPVHHQLPEFTQTHAHWVGDAIQPCHPLLSPSPPAPNPSQHQGLFQWVNSPHEVAKVLEFQLSISPSSEYPGLISFIMYWLDLLEVQGTLKSLLQHHNSKASILRFSTFLTVQLFMSIRDHWKNHNLDQTDLCWQSNVSAF